MKYVFIILVVLVLLRIDMFVGVVERGLGKIPKWSSSESISTQEVSPVSTYAIGGMQENLIPQFQLLLTEFSFNPDRATRELIEGFIQTNNFVSEISSANLASELTKWFGYTRTENPEVPLLLNKFMKFFKGDKFKLIQRFYSIYLDDHPEFFFHYYPHTLDPNCLVAQLSWPSFDRIDRERIVARMKIINGLDGKIQDQKVEFAKNCMLVLKVEESKVKNSPEESI